MPAPRHLIELFHLRLGHAPAQRLGALALLLLLLAVLTGVSLSQAVLLDSQADQLQQHTLPALRQGHALRQLVDDARGLEALQLLADDGPSRERLAKQLQRLRLQAQGQWAAVHRHAQASGDPALAQQADRVAQQLAAYWQAQDQVQLAVQAAALDPSQAGAARGLLAGPSQAAWSALGQALHQWLALQEQRAQALAQHSRSQAQLWRLGMGGLLAAVLLLSLGALVQRRRGPEGPSLGSAAGLSEALDGMAMHSRLVALNAAVQAARSGAPTACDLAERAQLAAAAEDLARRCDAAQRRWRLGQPPSQKRSTPRPRPAGTPQSLANEQGAPDTRDPA